MKKITNQDIFRGRDDNDLLVTYSKYYSVDHNYGADIDGNRGSTKMFFEHVEINDVETLTGKEYKLDRNEKKRILKLLNSY